MRAYDRSELLVFIHIPKTAGTAARFPFQEWFGEHFYQHYVLMPDGVPTIKLPDSYDSEHPVAAYGHFKRDSGYGVKDCVPEATQFMTMLRDPFEQAVSKYFYLRKEGVNHIDRTGVPCRCMEHYFMTLKSDILDYFPRELSFANYKEQIERYYIDIGITEEFDASIKRFARKLGMKYNERARGEANSTERTAVPSYLRDWFMERHGLEYAVYAYALQKHHAEEAANQHASTLP